MAIPDYGTGLAVVSDWPLRFTYASSFQNLANNLCRRLSTPRGSLAWDLNCGWDMRALLRDSLTPSAVAAAQSAIAAECEKDPRVNAASCVLTFIPQASMLTATISITGAQGPFAFVLSVDALTVALIKVAP